MGTPVVTMWETYGSGMAEVAALVAERLRLPVSPQAFTSEDLEPGSAGGDREVAWVLHLIGAGEPAPVPRPPGMASTAADLVTSNTERVLAAAARGGVIMGRNGARILAGRPNTLHVKLDGAADARIGYASERLRLSREQAARRLRREDEVRSRMSLDLYGWDPRENDHFDLVLNTSLLGIEMSARLVVAAAGWRTEEER